MINLFTYGSLMFAPVWQRVVRGHYRSAAACIDGYARFAIVGQTYPGLVAQPGAVVEGVVYFGVEARDVAALDVFEGADYRRDCVDATLEDGTLLSADTYVFIAGSGLSAAPWQPGAFELQRFLDTYCRNKLGK